MRLRLHRPRESKATQLKKAGLSAKKVNAGEDALFHVDAVDYVSLGVADGVGGWSEVSRILFWFREMANVFFCIEIARN